MHRGLIPLLLALVVLVFVLVFVLGAAPRAFAGDDEASSVAQLRPEEVAFLEKRFPEWSKLDPRRKEQIARNIVRSRNLSPEERTKLKQRMRRLHESRRGHDGQRRDRPRGMGIMRLADEVGTRILRRLPASVQTQVAALNVRPSMARMTVFKMAKSKAAAEQPWTLSPEDRAALPEGMRARVDSLLALAADPDGGKRSADARRSLQHMRLMKRLETLKKQLGADASAEAFVDAFMAEWSVPVDAVVADITARPQRFVESIERTSRGHMDRYDYMKSIWALERFATQEWRNDPEAQAAADRVVRKLLVDALKADPRQVEALPGYDAGRTRRQAIGRLFAGKMGKLRGRPDRRDGKRRGANGPRKRGGGDGVRKKRGDEKPGGDAGRGRDGDK